MTLSVDSVKKKIVKKKTSRKKIYRYNNQNQNILDLAGARTPKVYRGQTGKRGRNRAAKQR